MTTEMRDAVMRGLAEWRDNTGDERAGWEAVVDAARPFIEAETRERCGPDHTIGQPCHHLYSRCFRTDEELREYRVRQREHGARKEREHMAKEIKAYGERHRRHVENFTGVCDPLLGDRCDITAAYQHSAGMVEGAS